MGLADLIARLERDADARSAELDARTSAEADALRAEATRVARAHRERALAARRAERRARYDAALAEARRQARGSRLAAQHALLTRVFARARGLVPEVAQSAEYLAQLPEHYAEARRYVEGLPVVVRCPPALEARLPEDAEVVFVRGDAACLGVVVSAADGSVFIDNTLSARLQRLEARLSVELLAEVSDSDSVSLSPEGERVGERAATP